MVAGMCMSVYFENELEDRYLYNGTKYVLSYRNRTIAVVLYNT